MAAQALHAESVLSEQFTIDFGRPLPGVGGGLPAFAAGVLQGGGLALAAVQVRPETPPPQGPLSRLITASGPVSVPGCMTPLAHGTYNGGGTQEAYYLICPAPSGPPVGGPAGIGAPWNDNDLIDALLRPVAGVLERLSNLSVTHRGIRPDNLFRAGPGAAVTLGCGWATPPGLLQPAVFEPPYSAMCIPGGRGSGHIGDDVYALAVTMITLAHGRPPLQGIDDAEIIRRKLDIGCFNTLTAEVRLSPLVSDLVRTMLTEDPEHRPPPALLADPMAARGRRIAARPMRRALRPLDVGGHPVWNARMAAQAIGQNADAGAKLLQSGEVDRWLRRQLGDVSLAGRIDELTRQRPIKEDGSRTDAATQALLDSRSDALSAMRAVVAFDPLAPLCWRGTAFWPDAIGPALAVAHAASDTNTATNLEEIIGGEVVGRWAELRPERCDAALLRMDGRQHRLWQRQRGLAGGLPRLLYGLNPLLRCASPLVAGRYVASVASLLPALEAASARTELRRSPPLDKHIAAFIAGHIELPSDLDAGVDKDPVAAALQPLRLLATLQTRLRAPNVPGVAQWLAQHVGLVIETWNSRSRRKMIEEKLAAFAKRGDLQGMLLLLDDREGRQADLAGLERAGQDLRRLDTQIANVARAMDGRAEEARRIGQEVCVGVGMVSLVVSIGMAAL